MADESGETRSWRFLKTNKRRAAAFVLSLLCLLTSFFWLPLSRIQVTKNFRDTAAISSCYIVTAGSREFEFNERSIAQLTPALLEWFEHNLDSHRWRTTCQSNLFATNESGISVRFEGNGYNRHTTSDVTTISLTIHNNFVRCHLYSGSSHHLWPAYKREALAADYALMNLLEEARKREE
ncbi:hypothetical protein [Rubinisphaera brasiliensis]|uniref:Transmembrane protein n=1 Tax=Rubinisphaera brasiliensis (strain ATCC 49424 / DSM 5305 / JCM 21570 / IAM 15109 / NBRC 103401 / IFAM 1448) TaxID=756272 RepID=F0ST88_RUBBR|nr:hypothetical protein [Rubinisphaera brasiliensis]ADY59299.1 hypothetical protein Plabr_1688 [Rubinisphaera brasiliensis DSM 5305]